MTVKAGQVLNAPGDVARNRQQLHELAPRRGLLPFSNSDSAVTADARYSVAETFIHRFRSSTHR